MKKIQYLFLFFSFLLLPQALFAWGDGDRANNGGCKFDKEMGFSGSTLYTKGDEAYIIVDMTDTRYGTTSTVYNAKTCEKVTSGNKVDSDFEGLMQKKGFVETALNNSKNIDSTFKNKISFSNNDDEIVTKVESIDSRVSEEINNILSNISNKDITSQINISQGTKEFLTYSSVYSQIINKINSLSDEQINYDYTLALMNKLKSLNINLDASKEILLAKQESLETRINDKLFSSSVQSIKDVPNWMNKMIQSGRENRISNYIPQVLKLKDFGKTLTPNNFLNSIEYKYILKDLTLQNVSKIENNDKYYGISLNYSNKTIDLTQKPTCTKTGKTSTSEFRCGFFLMNTCVGTYDYYNCKGDTSAIAKVEKTLKGTTKVATALNKGWVYEPMISRYTKSDSSSGSSGGYGKDLKNLCLANNYSSYRSSCYSINDENLKNLCLANNYSSYRSSCYSINDENLKNLCLANNYSSYRGSCYSINDENLKNLCLANNYSSYRSSCYSIK